MADASIAGVCSGFAKYFNVSPIIVRLVWIFLVLVCGVGLLAYLICWLVIPSDGAVAQK